jgi:hypothetical protein
MHFKEWLTINENVEVNLDKWLGDIIKYAKPEEKRVLDSLASVTPEPPHLASPYRDSAIAVLKEKRLETPNWLAFSLGYLSAKKFRTEDLEIAVDVARKLIASGELPKSQIGQRGWLLTGRDIYPKVQEYLDASQRVSNRAERRMRKKGESADDDERLIRLVAQEENLKLYHLHSMGQGTKYGLPRDDEEIKARHRILCKYGKGTGWCTATPDGSYHQHYIGNNIYIVHEADKPTYQFVGCEDKNNHQFMDANDDQVEYLGAKTFSFLKRNADIGCYDISVKFDDLEEYKSADEESRNAISHQNVYELLKTGDPMEVVRALGENSAKIAEGIFSAKMNGPQQRRYHWTAANIVHDAFHMGSGGREFADWIADALPRQNPEPTNENRDIAARVSVNVLDFCVDKGKALKKLAPMMNSLFIGDKVFVNTPLSSPDNSVDLLELFLRAGVRIGPLNKLRHSLDPVETAGKMGAEINRLAPDDIRELLNRLEENEPDQVEPMREKLLDNIEGLLDNREKTGRTNVAIENLIELLSSMGISPSLGNMLSAPVGLGKIRKVIAQYDRNPEYFGSTNPEGYRNKPLAKLTPENIDHILEAVRDARKKRPGPSPEEVRKLIDDAKNSPPTVEDD